MKPGRKLFAFMLAALLCFSGCSKTEKAVKTIPTELAKLPDTIKLTAELPSDYPKSLPYYAVKRYEGDLQKAQEVLMKNEPNKKVEGDVENGACVEYWEEGKNMPTESIWASISQESYGKFYYSLEVPAFSKDKDGFLHHGYIEHYLAPDKPYRYSGDVFMQNPEFLEMKEYPAEKDLDFLPYADAKAQAEAAMKQCGLPDVELYLTESLTTEVMQHNREISNAKKIKDYEEEGVPEEEWSLIPEIGPEQEFYYFEYRQAQDGVPFANSIWWRSGATVGTETRISAVVAKDGLLDISGRGMFEVGEKLEEKTLISPEQALNVYLEEYNRAIRFDEHTIFSIELNYVVVSDETKTVARPVWMISSSMEKFVASPNPEAEPGSGDMLHDYRFTAVSADTGVILERGTDMR